MKFALPIFGFIIFFSISATISSASSYLSDEELDLVRSFEEESGLNFVSFFVDAVHQRELCTPSDKPCDVPLQKRTDPYVFLYWDIKYLESQHLINIFREGLDQTLEAVQISTGLSEREFDGRFFDFVALIVIDLDLYEADPKSYLDSKIARADDPNKESRYRAFEMFKQQDQIPCMFFSNFQDDGIIRDAIIWLRKTNDPDQIRQCIAEEIFNTLGLDEGSSYPSTFDWPLINQSSQTQLHALHLLMLKLLYAPEMLPGQNRSQTQKVTEHLIGLGSEGQIPPLNFDCELRLTTPNCLFTYLPE